MKRLNLNVANLNATEILSREELKHVLGGDNTGSGSANTSCANKTTYLKCSVVDPQGGPDIIKSAWTSVGCPSSNQCAAQELMTCSCV